MSSTAEQIMDTAESLIRSRGFQGFAFREVADSVGIKSASVHYHFPTKGDLAQAVLQRYAQRFASALQQIESETKLPEERLTRYIDMFRRELRNTHDLPPCIMLSADIAVLPDTVVQALKDFHRLNLDWLSVQLSIMRKDKANNTSTPKACVMFACLQGALIGARSLSDPTYFETVVEELEQQLTPG